MNALLWLISELVFVFTVLLLIYVVVGLLVQFGVVNAYNPLVNTSMNVLSRIIEPVLQPIRRFMPNLGGIDLSPMVLIIGLNFMVRLLREMTYG